MSALLCLIFRASLGLGLVFASACASKPKAVDAGEACNRGNAKACVTVYREMEQAADPKSEAMLNEICRMPRIRCLQLRPDESIEDLQVSNHTEELLYSQDVWRAGVFLRKQLIYYRMVEIGPNP